MKVNVAITLVFFLASCSSANVRQEQMNLVSLGMDKAQVIDILGTPQSSSAQAPYEYFIYSLSRKLTSQEIAACAGINVLTLGTGAALCFREEDRYIRFESGLVESYGRVGDFDSTNIPEATINVNTN